MPRAKAPTNTSATPKPPSRRKSRPKFEVAPEQVATPATGWVYRDDAEVEKPVTVRAELVSEVVAEPKSALPAADNPLAAMSMMAFGAVAVGIGTFVHIALFAVKTLNSPVRVASGLLNRIRRA